MRPNLVPVVPFVVSFIYETVQKSGGVQLNSKEALAFIKRHGVVLQSARGPVPSLAEAVAGGPIRGSWWGHPKGRSIYSATQAVCERSRESSRAVFAGAAEAVKEFALPSDSNEQKLKYSRPAWTVIRMPPTLFPDTCRVTRQKLPSPGGPLSSLRIDTEAMSWVSGNR